MTQPLLLANDGASLDLIDRVRDAMLHGFYSERESDRPFAVDRPIELTISGLRRSMMRMREVALRRPLTAAFVTRALPPLARDVFPYDRYAHVAWTPDLCPYPQWHPVDDDLATEAVAAVTGHRAPAWPDQSVRRTSLLKGQAFPFDSLAVARAAFAAPMLHKAGYERLTGTLGAIASLAIDDPSLPCTPAVACSAGTPWSPPSFTATNMHPRDVGTWRREAISMPTLTFVPTWEGRTAMGKDVAELVPTVLRVSEWHDDKGSRLVLSPMTVVIKRNDALDPMETIRLLAELQRQPLHLLATPDGRPLR